MRKSDLLRVQDVRDTYRLIGDCRDLGSEPALWQLRMLAGLCQLVGAPVFRQSPYAAGRFADEP